LFPQQRGAAAWQTSAGDFIETGDAVVLVGAFTNEDRDDFMLSPFDLVACRMYIQPGNRDDNMQNTYGKSGFGSHRLLLHSVPH
jgi:hypothetical protein